MAENWLTLDMSEKVDQKFWELDDHTSSTFGDSLYPESVPPLFAESPYMRHKFQAFVGLHRGVDQSRTAGR